MNPIAEWLLIKKLKQLKENPMLSKIVAFLEGKKSYSIAIATGVAAGLEAYGYHIPDWVWPALGALGLGFLRDAIAKGK